MIDTLNNIINDTMQQQHQHQNRDDVHDDRGRRSSRVGIESDNDYVEIKQLSAHLYKWSTEGIYVLLFVIPVVKLVLMISVGGDSQRRRQGGLKHERDAGEK